jgi:glucoside 3-dehydrogenase (cytochrome c) catalytic subunit
MPGKTPGFDAIVVGSGASGGWACKRLAEAGMKVALLEAGAPQSDKNFTEHLAPFELKYRDLAPAVVKKTRPIQIHLGCSEYNYKWFCNDLDEPYTTPPDRPFQWLGRLRMTGGRTNVWGRVSLRFSDLDFKAASHDGYGEDWPLGYSDLAPYYDLVEEYVGVAGMAEGLAHLPDGKFLPPMALYCQEVLLRNRAKEKLGYTVTPTRTANLTKPIHGRAQCHYCGPCERGCVTHSYFNSAFTTVADALQSGKCTLISNAMAYQVLMNSDQKRAKGVLYVDRNTHEPREIYGRTVILCAQAQESVRILLNSADPRHSNGLANSSGVLGRYLTAHIRNGGGSGELPAFGQKPSLNGPNRPAGIYIARFRNLEKGPASKNFLRGYGYEGGSGVDFNWSAPGFGDAYKKALLEPQSGLSMTGFGEVLPRWDNYVEIDRNLKDRYGIPVLRISMADGPNEKAMTKDMAESAGEMLEAAGAKNIKTYADPSRGRWAVHEAGIARMGNDPKASVLNQFQQTHDVQNLFVMDASGFTSNPCQNPTLTIMALCVRSCDYLMGEMKRGNI